MSIYEKDVDICRIIKGKINRKGILFLREIDYNHKHYDILQNIFGGKWQEENPQNLSKQFFLRNQDQE